MVYHVALITEATIAPIVAVNSCSSALVSETAMVMMPNPVAKTNKKNHNWKPAYKKKIKELKMMHTVK